MINKFMYMPNQKKIIVCLSFIFLKQLKLFKRTTLKTVLVYNTLTPSWRPKSSVTGWG